MSQPPDDTNSNQILASDPQFSMPLPFRWVFLSVLGLSLISLGIMLVMSRYDPLSDIQKRLFDSCDFAWKAGFGAILGLLGGKVTK